MAINVSFNGSTIYKPGSYSKRNIDLGGGFPLSPTGLIAIFGESTAGAPGSAVPDIGENVFSPDQLPLIRQIYRSGPIVDACNFLFAPGADGAIPGGAQAVYIYKTNASTKATQTLANQWGTLEAREWGTGGNRITVTISHVPADDARIVSTPLTLTGNALEGKTLRLRVQGATATQTFTCPSAIATVSDLETALQDASNWAPTMPADLKFTVTGVSTAAIVTVERETDATVNREGYGRNFEIVDGADLGLQNRLVVADSENAAIIAVNNTRDLITESSTLGGKIVLKVGRLGGTNPTVSVTDTQLELKNNGVTEYTINKADFATINEVVDFISVSTGGDWLAAVGSTLYGQLSPNVLDQVTNLGAATENLNTDNLPAQIKMDAFEVVEFMEQSTNIALEAGNNSVCGLPDAQPATYLTGGSLGGTSTAEITDALTQFQKVRVNAVVPLFSRDAIADKADGLTDTSSTYTIAGIHQAVKTHCSLTATTKARSERQGYLSLKDTFTNCKLTAQNLADARIQLTIQDVRQVNSNGGIQWFQPWALACMLAGARGGSPIGLPMTNKYFNVSGIRQTAQSLNTPEDKIVEDFNPDTQYDDAIRNGITFLERPQTGGFRIVVDNTTYGRDGNWVYNRANVLYAADILEYDFRTQLQNIYVGVKNTTSVAEIAGTCASLLAGYLAQGITVSTPDARQGYKQLDVKLMGNTIEVSVVVKLVEGIDFVLSSISLQRATS